MSWGRHEKRGGMSWGRNEKKREMGKCGRKRVPSVAAIQPQEVPGAGQGLLHLPPWHAVCRKVRIICNITIF